MSLESLIRQGIIEIDEGYRSNDLSKLTKNYASNVVSIDVKTGKIYVGEKGLTELLQEWAGPMEGSKTTAADEKFEGSEQLIRYACTTTTVLKDGKQFVAKVLQYWRQVDGKYVVETDLFELLD
ncbi:unnamed protein product, partial [Mesorhabditis spiculigera]